MYTRQLQVGRILVAVQPVPRSHLPFYQAVLRISDGALESLLVDQQRCPDAERAFAHGVQVARFIERHAGE